MLETKPSYTIVFLATVCTRNVSQPFPLDYPIKYWPISLFDVVPVIHYCTNNVHIILHTSKFL
jgi:hypothetical protein